MIVKDSAFCKELRRMLLEGEAPCGFSLDGTSAPAVFSAPECLAQTGGCTQWQRTARLGALSLVLQYRVYGEAVIFGLRLCNTGDAPSGLITDVEFARFSVRCIPPQNGRTHYARLLYNRGSDAKDVDFAPQDEPFFPEPVKTFTNRHGRSCEEIAPYFNMDLTNGTGFFAAVGWSGHWQASFGWEPETAPAMKASAVLRYTDAAFRLQPGECVELPQALVLPWQTDAYSRELSDAFNAFRRLMREHIQPRPGGREFHMPVMLRAWGSVTPEGHAGRLENVRKHGLRGQAYGIDAGWYQLGDRGTPQPDWWTGVGDWIPAADIFPEGIGALARRAAEEGMGFWLWVELERAVHACDAIREHPEFYLYNAANEMYDLVDMGNPEARAFLLEKVCTLIDETAMAVFRLDFNTDPAPLFADCDAHERRGMTELHYYNGLYTLFGELLHRYPDMVIDNCAAGGRRLDWRLCSYAIPLMCSSDYFTAKDYDPEGIQAHTWGLSRWLPVSGDSCGSCTGQTRIVMDTYRVRSSMRSCIGLAAPDWELSAEEAAWYRKMIADMETVAPYMALDAYPLTGWSLSPLDWIAWERCAADGSRGLVMAFRRADAADAVRTFALRGVDTQAQYRLTDIDAGDMGVCTGAQLTQGLSVAIPQPRTARILFFEKTE